MLGLEVRRFKISFGKGKTDGYRRRRTQGLNQKWYTRLYVQIRHATHKVGACAHRPTDRQAYGRNVQHRFINRGLRRMQRTYSWWDRVQQVFPSFASPVYDAVREYGGLGVRHKTARSQGGVVIQIISPPFLNHTYRKYTLCPSTCSKANRGIRLQLVAYVCSSAEKEAGKERPKIAVCGIACACVLHRSMCVVDTCDMYLPSLEWDCPDVLVLFLAVQCIS